MPDHSSNLTDVTNIKIIQKRYFPVVNDVEVEICEDNGGYLFVRHNVYWWLAHRNKNPDPVHNCVLDNLSLMTNNRLDTIRWSGYSFKYQTIFLAENGGEISTVLLPLEMFEDFIRWSPKNYGGHPPPDYLDVKLGKWLENNSLKDLVKVSNEALKEKEPNYSNQNCSFFQSLIKLFDLARK
ncbi:hypothetical protein [Pseudocalidococcus azoricus]|nr:hypothetical protein [Pseudocalidococcus azoricus]